MRMPCRQDMASLLLQPSILHSSIIFASMDYRQQIFVPISRLRVLNLKDSFVPSVLIICYVYIQLSTKAVSRYAHLQRFARTILYENTVEALAPAYQGDLCECFFRMIYKTLPLSVIAAKKFPPEHVSCLPYNLVSTKSTSWISVHHRELTLLDAV